MARGRGRGVRAGAATFRVTKRARHARRAWSRREGRHKTVAARVRPRVLGSDGRGRRARRGDGAVALRGS
eukprot:365413-Chlamydomonas_euryale.AAC.3